ncbi:hypothetical protein BH10BAC5_BH10BAC5_01560 [soil metagenome]
MKRPNYSFNSVKALFSALLLFIALNANAADYSDVYNKCISSVGLITDNTGSVASGFFINKNTFITNAHVTEEIDLTTAKIKMKDGRKFHVSKIIGEYKKMDLSILETTEMSDTYLPLASDKFIKEGENVFSLGNPTDRDFNISYYKMTTGEISEVYKDTWNYGDNYDHKALVIKHTAIIHEGNSGGPLVTEDGEVAGVNAFFYDRSDELNYAIHTDELISILKDNGIQYTLDTKTITPNKEYTITKQSNDDYHSKKRNRYEDADKNYEDRNNNGAAKRLVPKSSNGKTVFSNDNALYVLYAGSGYFLLTLITMTMITAIVLIRNRKSAYNR